MERFAGKNVLLTGAATGIGRATALRLAGEGARVLAVDLNPEIPEHAAITPHVADVADEAQVKAAVARAVEELGGLDALINVAGVHKTTPLATLTLDDFRRLLEINLLGTFLFCREAMPYLVERKGVVVNTASTSATHAHPFMTGYAASKGGVLAFSLSLAAEVAPQGVRVVAVSPGGVVTPLMTSVSFPEGVDASFYGRIMPQVGFGEPEAIAGTIAYAASADGAYLTGVELRVDGGSHV
ncbi:SDR family NAD(P)-dependent oxidoreductase [Nonomuraea sp. NPDC050790]|uniref:SDR family NAD(P)-dependent oxidoreductase n=1 Tax=Nonomuraea sp. NPDC050790 TaxID=3364371 RepID=UPI0037895993